MIFHRFQSFLFIFQYIDQVDQESTYESGYKLREHPIQQFENNVSITLLINREKSASYYQRVLKHY